MKKEIERKFLVQKEDLVSLLMFMPHCSYDIWQYYISEDVRLRTETHSDGVEKANFTIKISNDSLLERDEWESSISVSDAESLRKNLIKSRVGLGSVRKTRHVLRGREGMNWEIDIFHGSNEGLIIAEIELPNKDYKLELNKCPWIGEEVTNNEKYYNSYLAANSYLEWKDEGRQT